MKKPTAIAAIVLILAACAALLYGQEPTLEELQQRLEAAETYRDGVKAELDTAKATVTTLEAELLSAELAVVSAQRDVDNYVPPAPEPEPEPDCDALLMVNGQKWTFKTPPPADLAIRPHPRFLVPGRADEIRAKFDDPQWDNELRRLRGSMTLNALRYALFGDTAAGNAAKTEALTAYDAVQNTSGSDNYVDILLAYDWTYDLWSPADKEDLFRIVMGEAGLSIPPPGSVEFEVNGTRPRNTAKGDGLRDWYSNDVHEPRNHANGVQLRGGIALAFHGDGVRDEWCQYVYEMMLNNRDGRIYPIYDAERGGLLDLHNSMALDSGGSQAGNHGETITGYSSMFYASCPRLMLMWESATGDSLFPRDNFYRLSPQWVAYRQRGVGDNQSLQSMHMLTGIYRNVDPQAAGLAAWVGEQFGTGKYYEVWVLCTADRSVAPLSPYDAGLPLADYRRGDDFCVSFTDFEPDATQVFLSARTLDTSRYEMAVGLLRINSRGEKMLIAGQAKKGEMHNIYGSGMWIWPTGQNAAEEQQSTTFWGGHHSTHQEGRADFPYDVATDPFYRGTVPTENHGGTNYHVFTVDSKEFWTDGATTALDVRKCKRTIAHLMGEREFVVVCDRIEVGPGLSHCWGGRVMNKPHVTGNRFTTVNESMAMAGTVLEPAALLDVRGGPGKATEGPNGESYDKSGYIFRDDDSRKDRFGSYALFIKPNDPQSQQRYIVVLEIGDAGFVPAAATLDGKTVSVDGWTVDFSTEDETKVSK